MADHMLFVSISHIIWGNFAIARIDLVAVKKYFIDSSSKAILQGISVHESSCVTSVSLYEDNKKTIPHSEESDVAAQAN